ncbi:MAG TPA: flagellar hook-length control protein FliK, partial [Denitromonas sp.]|nr:flagellar hook-length control protein FliK [Denitromonas sp.]
QPLQSSAGPLNPAALAAALRQGISESGLFYESHLARWSAGDLSTEVLRREPQARQAAPQNANQSGQNTPTPQSTTATDSSTASRGAATAQATVGARTDTIPDRLLPVMHQQLDALATHNYSWLGQAWPGQVMELEIEDPQHDDGDTPAEDAPWKTTLRLSLPTLGGVEARIALDASGIRIRLSADNPATAETLAQRRGTLSDAMGQANITVKELLVGPGS